MLHREEVWYKMSDYESDIYENIKTLYTQKWYQPNACYPTQFYYCTNGMNTALPKLMKRCYNEGYTPKNETISKLGRITSLSDYLSEETKALKENTQSMNDCLPFFTELNGLSSLEVPLSNSVYGGLQASNGKGPNASKGQLTFSFLLNSKFDVLEVLQAWQSYWYVNNWERQILKTKRSEDEGAGEGYFGIKNVRIDQSGRIDTLSYLSIFGLVPIKIDTKPLSKIGPGTKSSELPKIELKCAYSKAILIYPRTNSTVNYYYY